MGVLGCAVTSFVVRLRFPTTHEFRLLNLRVGYVPQYLCAYILGSKIEPNQVTLLPGNSVRIILATVFAIIPLSVSQMGLASRKVLEDHGGGMNAAAAIYTITNELAGYLLFATAFHQFRRHCNSLWGTFPNLNYAIFLSMLQSL
jgi:hypothetical protein